MNPTLTRRGFALGAETEGDLDTAIVAYFVDPDHNPCPPALALNWRLGEQRLIVAGGMLDQPAGTWQAQQRAGYVWYLLEQEASVTKDMSLDKLLKPADLKVLLGDPDKPGDEGLRGIRKRLIMEKRNGR